MDGGAWLATVHGVTKSWTWLSDFTSRMTLIFQKTQFDKRKITFSNIINLKVFFLIEQYFCDDIVYWFTKYRPATLSCYFQFQDWKGYIIHFSPFYDHMMGFPCGSAGKESACNAEELGLIPGLERPLEKGKATHSSILAWRIPWTVQSMGSQRVRHDWVSFTFMAMWHRSDQWNVSRRYWTLLRMILHFLK